MLNWMKDQTKNLLTTLPADFTLIEGKINEALDRAEDVLDKAVIDILDNGLLDQKKYSDSAGKYIIELSIDKYFISLSIKSQGILKVAALLTLVYDRNMKDFSSDVVTYIKETKLYQGSSKHISLLNVHRNKVFLLNEIDKIKRTRVPYMSEYAKVVLKNISQVKMMAISGYKKERLSEDMSNTILDLMSDVENLIPTVEYDHPIDSKHIIKRMVSTDMYDTLDAYIKIDPAVRTTQEKTLIDILQNIRLKVSELYQGDLNQGLNKFTFQSALMGERYKQSL